VLISDFAIRRPIITIVSMLALVVFGLFSLLKLETDEFPDVQQPIVNVAIPYPGASPDVVEREVLDPIEEAIAGISGVDKIDGTAQDGFANITTYFVYEKELQQASQDIRDKISAIRGDLPQEMEEPILTRFDPADQPILQIALTSSALDAAALTRLADPAVVRELRAVPGVAEVKLVGGVERELTVELDPTRMLAARIAAGEVVAALGQQNLAAPVGRITGALDETSIRLRGKLERPEDFQQLVVAQRDGRLIRLGDVATVRDGTQEARTLALYGDGAAEREAVGILVLKSKGYSTTTVADGVKARLDALRATLPAGTTLAVIQDGGERVTNSVRNVQETLVEGALLTVFVVFLFLNSWRSTVITGLALPVSVLAAFIAVWAFGFTLNTMSLLGLSLAIGILIDDAIVVRENIVRHIEMGKDHFAASHDGTDEIGMAVAATTFSIVAVFAPIAFMGGVSGQWFKPFALTIACAVLVSLFVSFSLDPMLSAYWADPQVEAHERRNPIARALDRFNAWFNRMAERYTGVIAWALDHRLAMVALAIGTFVGAMWLQGTFGGFGFVPVSDRSELTMEVEVPPGSNLDYTRLKLAEAARIARAHPEVAYTFTTVGGGSAEPGGSLGSVDRGSVYVKLVPKAERSINQDRFGARLRGEVAGIGGATVYVFSSGFGGALKQIQVQVRGNDAATLQGIAEDLMAKVKTIPGAADVGLSTKGQKPELDVSVNRGLAGTLGVTLGQVAQNLRIAFAGLDAGDWVDPSGETRDIYVRLSPEARRRQADLERMPIVLPGQGGGGRHDDPAEPDRDGARGARPGGDLASRPRQRGQGAGEHQRAVPGRGHHRHPAGDRPAHAAPGGGDHHRWGGGGPGRGVRRHPGGARARGAADVPDPGDAVRVVPRPDRDHDLAPAVTDRRGARAAHHRGHAEHHVDDRDHPADGDRGEERDPADRLRQVGTGAGDGPPRGDHRGGARAPAADHDDDAGADRGDDPRGARAGRGGGLPRAARARDHRRDDHLDAADAARDPDDLRDPGRMARVGPAEAGLHAAAEGGGGPDPDVGGGGLRAEAEKMRTVSTSRLRTFRP
jgi:HAE1 family hydrophobic/amphiphilic exporter-1